MSADRPPRLTLTGARSEGRCLRWTFDLDHAWGDDVVELIIRTAANGHLFDVQWAGAFGRAGAGYPFDDPELPCCVEARLAEELARVQLAEAFRAASSVPQVPTGGRWAA